MGHPETKPAPGSQSNHRYLPLSAALIFGSNFAIWLWLYQTIGWHDFRGFIDVTWGLVAIFTTAVAIVDLVLAAVCVAGSDQEPKIPPQRRLASYFFIAGLAMGFSPFVSPIIGRGLTHLGLIYTPIGAASLYGDTAMVQSLLKRGADVNQPWGGAGGYPLHHMAGRGETEMVKLLLEKGADPNARDGGGGTPLHSAARGQADPELVRLLLHAGADPRLKNRDGRMAFAEFGHRWKEAQTTAIFGSSPPTDSPSVVNRWGP